MLDKRANKNKICILVQATGSHWVYIKDLVESIRAYFLTESYREIIVLSDVMAEMRQPLAPNCYVHNIKCKPYTSASYFFELLIHNLDVCYDSDFIFKMDADTLVHNNIRELSILPRHKENFFGVEHFLWDHFGVSKIRPQNYSANIPNEFQDSAYFQTCLFGGRTKNMIQMAFDINSMITADRDQGTMWGAWEEPYVNYYFALRQNEVRILSPAYASPFYWHNFTYARDRYEKLACGPEQIFHFNHQFAYGPHPAE